MPGGLTLGFAMHLVTYVLYRFMQYLSMTETDGHADIAYTALCVCCIRVAR